MIKNKGNAFEQGVRFKFMQRFLSLILNSVKLLYSNLVLSNYVAFAKTSTVDDRAVNRVNIENSKVALGATDNEAQICRSTSNTQSFVRSTTENPF